MWASKDNLLFEYFDERYHGGKGVIQKAIAHFELKPGEYLYWRQESDSPIQKLRVGKINNSRYEFIKWRPL